MGDVFSGKRIEKKYMEENGKILYLSYKHFINDNLNIKTLEKKNIKINNKIIHQSKLLKYFEENYQTEKIEEDLNKLLKSIKTKLKTL